MLVHIRKFGCGFVFLNYILVEVSNLDTGKENNMSNEEKILGMLAQLQADMAGMKEQLDWVDERSRRTADLLETVDARSQRTAVLIGG